MSDEDLDRAGRAVGLQDCFFSNPQNPVEPSVRLVATLVEAILGAVHLDDQYDRTEALRWVTMSLYIALWDYCLSEQ